MPVPELPPASPPKPDDAPAQSGDAANDAPPQNGSARRSLASIASIVAAATLLSKVAGLVRQQAIAAAFGAGPVFDAYTFAYVIPGFLLILLGGINGPFHSAMVSVLARRDRREAAAIVETTATAIGAILFAVSLALVAFAGPIIDTIAPGLSMDPTLARSQGLGPDDLAALAQTRELAVLQLQVMAPIALLAGLVGIGFGTLNVADRYWLPSISPLLSSATTLAAIGVFFTVARPEGGSLDAAAIGTMVLGAALLAGGTTAGALLQWLIQIPAQIGAKMGGLRLRWHWNHPGVREVMRIMGPATLSSGMLQINLYTDLFFASYIPQAAAALNYANLLVQTPLGLTSNAVLVPLLPLLSRLADRQGEFQGRLRQGLLVTALTMLPLSAVMVPLAQPIVRVVYERGAFGASDSALVASVLAVGAGGMFVYLSRDVMVRAFYALGDATTPFRISLANIFFNVLLDFWFVRWFGAPGVVLATVGTNAIALGALLAMLHRRQGGLPWGEWLRPFAGVLAASAAAALVCWGARWGLDRLWAPEALLGQLAALAIAAGAGLGAFALLVMPLNLPEVEWLQARLRQRFRR